MTYKIKNLWHLFNAVFWSLWYGFPGKKLKVIGITGTDGKTTTSFYIYNILKSAGLKVGLITTIEARVGEKSYDTGFHVTTPDAKAVNKFLSEMVSQECEYVVLETTSHGLDQHRVLGIPFLAGVITNVTHEHLDYHKTFENYLKTKSILIRNSDIAVLNKDDPSFEYLSKATKGRVVGFSAIEGGLDRSLIKIPGDYNYSNALAAATVARELNISEDAIKTGIETLENLPGRMEYIQKEPFAVIVDFAHTPNALENTLKSVRPLTTGKIISVFGCAGLRDASKRPIMGKIASDLADTVVITAEDPRTESFDQITSEIATGMDPRKIHKIADRQEAINYAIQKLAQPGDIVLITGKGHENSMCFGKTEYPWSDREAVLRAL